VSQALAIKKTTIPHHEYVMEIKYKTTKNEVFYFYKKRWKEKLWRFHIVIFLCSTFVVYNQFTHTQFSNSTKIIIASFFGLLILSIMPLIPLIFHKKDERSLLVTDDGIETTIGTRHGVIPWNKIAHLEKTEEYIYITGKNQNGFIIPNSAFNTKNDKSLFFNKINKYIG
jgi:hypothetical protein